MEDEEAFLKGMDYRSVLEKWTMWSKTDNIFLGKMQESIQIQVNNRIWAGHKYTGNKNQQLSLDKEQSV